MQTAFHYCFGQREPTTNCLTLLSVQPALSLNFSQSLTLLQSEWICAGIQHN